MIKELGDKGELVYCGKIVELMRRLNMRPSIVTYSTLISRAGAWKKVSLAERYFQEMIRYSYSDRLLDSIPFSSREVVFFLCLGME